MILLTSLTIGCSITPAGDDEPPPPDPATCPAPPFEICGYRDGGWDVYCDAGVIWQISHNGAMYCAPPDPEVVCYTIDETPRVRAQCPVAACNPNPAMQRKYLETVDEYDKFDVTTLCGMP